MFRLSAAMALLATGVPAHAASGNIPLTGDETAAFAASVAACWTPPDNPAGMPFVLGFSMGRDGRPVAESFRLIGGVQGDPARQQAFDAARRAVMRCARDGYDLPAGKYNEWNRIEMTFTPAGVEGFE